MNPRSEQQQQQQQQQPQQQPQPQQQQQQQQRYQSYIISPLVRWLSAIIAISSVLIVAFNIQQSHLSSYCFHTHVAVKQQTMQTYIAGDLGGTNCRLLLVQWSNQTNVDEKILLEVSYSSKDYSHLLVILQEFLQTVKSKSILASNVESPKICCMAVAGPVENKKFANITNLNWNLNASQMSEQLQLENMVLINDFAAIGYGLLAVENKHLVALNDVPADTTAPIACLGAGTGLGEVYLTHNGHEYDVWDSEGGHADFAPRSMLEFELLMFVKELCKVDRVSVERIVSGTGLPYIYQFFKSKNSNLISDSVEAQMQSEDASKVITDNALAQNCTLCQQAFELWLELYGAETGNLALKTLSYGGLYIAGGIAPKIAEVFSSSDRFWSNVRAKGRMAAIIDRIPVFVVVHPNVGMLGARVLSRRLVRKRNS